VRLIIDETIAITDKRASILVSSTAKNNIVSVISGVITLASTTAALTVGDDLTIEIDIDNIAKESAATANKEAIIAAINSAEPDLSSVAKETSVKDGNDTTIGMLKDQTNGLAAIKAAIPTVANIQNGLAQESSVKSGNDTTIAVAKAIQDAVGSAPSGSEITTLFAWLTTIYEYLAGQTPEEIPEGLGDRINLLLQFFGLPQALPEYQSMTEQEGRAINDDLWEVFYGFNTAKVKIHIKISENEDFASYVWLDTSKTYGDYYSELYDAEGNSVLTDNPEETDPVTELYTYIVE
jgi:hypothetical protein